MASPTGRYARFFTVGAGMDSLLRIFCVMRKEVIRDLWHGKRIVRILDRLCGFSVNRADSGPIVRIFEDLCGFVRGIFRCMRLEIGGFSPKRTVSGRFWAVGNPHDLPRIRTAH